MFGVLIRGSVMYRGSGSVFGVVVIEVVVCIVVRGSVMYSGGVVVVCVWGSG